MRHPNTLLLGDVVFVITDMQDAFQSAISDFSETAVRIARIAHAAHLLNMPIVVTEQYPKGLGHTVNEIKAVLPSGVPIIEKIAFSSWGAEDFSRQLERTGASQILIAGIEAHICVNQTVHDLLAHGYRVHLLTDCINSRAPQDKQIALEKMQRSGAIPSATEMALFELMRDSKHPQFKTIQNLVK